MGEVDSGFSSMDPGRGAMAVTRLSRSKLARTLHD